MTNPETRIAFPVAKAASAGGLVGTSAAAHAAEASNQVITFMGFTTAELSHYSTVVAAVYGTAIALEWVWKKVWKPFIRPALVARGLLKPVTDKDPE